MYVFPMWIHFFHYFQKHLLSYCNNLNCTNKAGFPTSLPCKQIRDTPVSLTSICKLCSYKQLLKGRPNDVIPSLSQASRNSPPHPTSHPPPLMSLSRLGAHKPSHSERQDLRKNIIQHSPCAASSHFFFLLELSGQLAFLSGMSAS